MNKKRVLDSTASLFARYGIKTVSMDTIATHLKMSKKTLYEIFSDKEDLVNKCLHNEMLRILSFSGRMEEYSESPVEKLIIQSVVSYGYILGYCPAFYKDLEKYTIACEVLERHSKSLINDHKQILNMGIAQGYFDPELNPDIIMRIFRDQMNQIKRAFGEDRMPATDFLYMLTTILKGICTDKGAAELERIRTKWTKSGMMDKLTLKENI